MTEAFEKVIQETLEVRPMRLLAYCLMSNHWHMLLGPEHDGDLARFMQRLTITHVRRWVEYHQDQGNGHVYQGRYKSFPVQSDEHYLSVARYIERNALRAQLVQRAEEWRYGSLWRREQGTARQQAILSSWPVEMPRDWVPFVNEAQSEAEVEALRSCVRRGSPFGSHDWVVQVAASLGLQSTLRGRGRPHKQPPRWGRTT